MCSFGWLLYSTLSLLRQIRCQYLISIKDTHFFSLKRKKGINIPSLITGPRVLSLGQSDVNKKQLDLYSLWLYRRKVRIKKDHSFGQKKVECP